MFKKLFLISFLYIPLFFVIISINAQKAMAIEFVISNIRTPSLPSPGDTVSFDLTIGDIPYVTNSDGVITVNPPIINSNVGGTYLTLKSNTNNSLNLDAGSYLPDDPPASFTVSFVYNVVSSNCAAADKIIFSTTPQATVTKPQRKTYTATSATSIVLWYGIGGNLIVNTTPSNASVTLDGNNPTTGHEFKGYNCGQYHSLTVSASGYASKTIPIGKGSDYTGPGDYAICNGTTNTIYVALTPPCTTGTSGCTACIIKNNSYKNTCSSDNGNQTCYHDGPGVCDKTSFTKSCTVNACNSGWTCNVGACLNTSFTVNVYSDPNDDGSGSGGLITSSLSVFAGSTGVPNLSGTTSTGSINLSPTVLNKTYTVQVSSVPEHYKKGNHWFTSATSTVSNPHVTVNLYLVPLYIGGNVYWDSNGDGLGDSPITSGTTVWAYSTKDGNHNASDITRSDGSYGYVKNFQNTPYVWNDSYNVKTNPDPPSGYYDLPNGKSYKYVSSLPDGHVDLLFGKYMTISGDVKLTSSDETSSCISRGGAGHPSNFSITYDGSNPAPYYPSNGYIISNLRQQADHSVNILLPEGYSLFGYSDSSGTCQSPPRGEPLLSTDPLYPNGTKYVFSNRNTISGNVKLDFFIKPPKPPTINGKICRSETGNSDCLEGDGQTESPLYTSTGSVKVYPVSNSRPCDEMDDGKCTFDTYAYFYDGTDLISTITKDGKIWQIYELNRNGHKAGDIYRSTSGIPLTTFGTGRYSGSGKPCEDYSAPGAICKFNTYSYWYDPVSKNLISTITTDKGKIYQIWEGATDTSKIGSKYGNYNGESLNTWPNGANRYSGSGKPCEDYSAPGAICKFNTYSYWFWYDDPINKTGPNLISTITTDKGKIYQTYELPDSHGHSAGAPFGNESGHTLKEFAGGRYSNPSTKPCYEKIPTTNPCIFNTYSYWYNTDTQELLSTITTDKGKIYQIWELTDPNHGSSPNYNVGDIAYDAGGKDLTTFGIKNRYADRSDKPCWGIRYPDKCIFDTYAYFYDPATKDLISTITKDHKIWQIYELDNAGHKIGDYAYGANGLDLTTFGTGRYSGSGKPCGGLGVGQCTFNTYSYWYNPNNGDLISNITANNDGKIYQIWEGATDKTKIGTKYNNYSGESLATWPSNNPNRYSNDSTKPCWNERKFGANNGVCIFDTYAYFYDGTDLISTITKDGKIWQIYELGNSIGSYAYGVNGQDLAIFGGNRYSKTNAVDDSTKPCYGKTPFTCAFNTYSYWFWYDNESAKTGPNLISTITKDGKIWQYYELANGEHYTGDVVYGTNGKDLTTFGNGDSRYSNAILSSPNPLTKYDTFRNSNITNPNNYWVNLNLTDPQSKWKITWPTTSTGITECNSTTNPTSCRIQVPIPNTNSYQGGDNTGTVVNPYQNFSVWPKNAHSISGLIFKNQNEDDVYTSNENFQTDCRITIEDSTDSTKKTLAFCNRNDGTYSADGIVEGTYHVYLDPMISGYYKNYPHAGTNYYTVTVGSDCSRSSLSPHFLSPYSPDPDHNTDSTACSSGNLYGVDFGVNQTGGWEQFACGDAYQNSFNPPSATCNTFPMTNSPSYCSVSHGIAVSKGSLTGNFAADPNWKVESEFVGSVHNSYDNLVNKTNPADLKDLKSKCTGGIGNCSLSFASDGSDHGIYIIHNNLNLSDTPSSYTFPSGNYIILVDGDLTINSKIIVPVGTTVTFAVQGNIYVADGVGEVGSTTTCDPTKPLTDLTRGCDIEGWYIADGSFDAGGSLACSDSTTNDKRLNIAGAVIVNAEKNGGGSFANKRVFCNTTGGVSDSCYPSLTITQRPDFILNAPEFLETKGFTWQEVAP